VALTYDLGDIEDFESVCYDDLEDGMVQLKMSTQTIIFGSMVVDIGKITEDNYIEWWQRYNIWGTTRGVDPIDLELVKAHIGLHTNVITRTTHSWMTERLKEFMITSERSIRYTEQVARKESQERHPAGKDR